MTPDKTTKYDLNILDGDFSRFYINDVAAEGDRDINEPFGNDQYDPVECHAFLDACGMNSTFHTNNLGLANAKERVAMQIDLAQFELLLGVLKIIDAQPAFPRKNHPVRDIVKMNDMTEELSLRHELHAQHRDAGATFGDFNEMIRSSLVDKCKSGKTLQELIDEYLGRTDEVRKLVFDKRKSYREYMQECATQEQLLVSMTQDIRNMLQERIEG